MPFVSYAQNFEDLMLWRALGHIENGFYIDIGALSPNFDTVTRAFCENGWRGINIEPNPKYLAELQKVRPNDINLGVAVSDCSGTVTFNLIENPGLSTINSEIAQAHKDKGMASQIIETEARTVAEIWKEHINPGQDVHFLKIDVEGHEAAVLRGGDWKTHRPWIFVIEATSPNTSTESHDDWEPVILNCGYQMVYWDGLNRFYLAEEHLDLVSAFSSPPNVFDDYELARYTAPIAHLHIELQEATKAREEAMKSRDDAENDCRDAVRAREDAESAYRDAVVARDDAEKAFRAQREHSNALERALSEEKRARLIAEESLMELQGRSVLDLAYSRLRERYGR